MSDDLMKFARYMNMYKSICGVIKESDIDKIVKFYNLKLTDKEIKDTLSGILSYVDGYYVFYEELINDDFLNTRGDLSIRLLSDSEINEYWIKLTMISIRIDEIVDDASLADEMFNYQMACKGFTFEDDVISPALEHFNLKMDIYYKIVKIFMENDNIIRYWFYYGRTEDECYTDSVYESMLLKEKPKNNTILDCLNLLDSDSLRGIYDFYEFEGSIDELRDIIIDCFEEDSLELTKVEYDAYMRCEFSYVLSNYDFLNGFVFGYIEDGVRKIIVPNELMDILKNVNYNDLENEFDYSVFENMFDEIAKGFQNELNDIDLIIGYLTINGILSKDKLIEMIKNNHGIVLTYDDVDNLIKDFPVYTIDGKYYSLIDDKYDALNLLSIKSKSDNYKVLNKDIVKYEQEVLDSILEFINDNWDNDDNKIIINSFIFDSLKFGVLNNDALNMLSNDLSLNKNEIKLIENFIKKYKNGVGIWTFNGYSFDDKKCVKKEKIGRNDPCPCGSGKKYKKCCGK